MLIARRCSLVLVGLWLTFGSTAKGQESQSSAIVAVFLIENRGTSLTEQELVSLTDYFGTKLGERGRFQIIPREEIRNRVVAAKQESYNACFDQSCQVEIGRELAAQFIVSSSLSKVGKQCLITAAMYDLKKATTSKTATEKGSCAVDDLVAAMEKIATRLQESGAERAAERRASEAEVPAPRRSNRLNLKLSPTRFRFETIDEKHSYSVELVAPDGESHRCAEVRAGEACNLKDLVQGEARLVVRSAELGTYTDDFDIEEANEVWVYTLGKRASHGSVIAWTFGGLAIATGAALIPVGLATDKSGFVYGGIPSAVVGVGLLLLGFLFDGNVAVSQDELEIRTPS